MIDIRQSVEYGKHLRNLGWVVERVEGVNYFIKRFSLIGSVLKIQRPNRLEEKEIEVIKKLSKQYRVFQTIIEPSAEKQARKIQSRGYGKSRSTYLPSKTLELDLTLSQTKLFNNLKKDSRYSIKKSSGITLFTQAEPEIFHESYKNTAWPRRHTPPLKALASLKASFPDTLYLTSHNGIQKNKLYQSGAIFVKSGTKAYYWQAFTSKEGRTSLSQYQLVWQGILWAKKNGAKIFDFEGIYDPRFPNKSWHGFTHFKKSFGGYEASYPGAYTKWRLPT